MFEVLPTDKRFLDSPSAGDPECSCSRCGERIYHFAVRAHSLGEDGEYRFHPECLGMQSTVSTLVAGAEEA